MSQQNVFKYLRARPNKEFTSTEIADGVKLPLNTVNNNLKKLRKDNLILFREKPKGKGGYLYKYDRFNEVLVKLQDDDRFFDDIRKSILDMNVADYKSVEEVVSMVIVIAKNRILQKIKDVYRIEYQKKRLASEHYKLAKKNKIKLKIPKRK